MINWQRVFLNLRSAGISTTDAAHHIGMCVETAQRYARGERTRDPLLTHGLRLLDLHKDRCPQQHRVDVIGRP